MPNRPVKTVLLVDDQSLLAAWARDFAFAGKEVLKATDGETAVRLAKETKPELALVELFLVGGASGLDVVRALRVLDEDMFIVLLSANMSVAYAVEGVRAGADDVLFKSVPWRQVLERAETGTSVEVKGSNLSLDQLEWEHITRVMLECNNNVTLAAKQLGIYRQTLQRKLRKRLQGM